MGSKILLGLIMGFLAGGAAKALTTANATPSLAPVHRGWFNISATAAPLVAFVWIIYTFGAYSAKFGFMAIGEVIIGAIVAGLLSHQARLKIAFIALPATIIAWIVL